MSECPYKNFKNKVNNFINLLRKPRKEYSGMAPCPFVGAEVDRDKLMIELFDPSKNSILDMVKKLEDSKYESAILVQVSGEDLNSADTYKYQVFINSVLRTNELKHLKCICITPKDNFDVGGFSIRQNSPYFLINITRRDLLAKTHEKLLNTKYYDNMSQEYLDYLQVKKEKK